MQKQPELVCKKTVTGGTVALGVGLMIFDVELIISSGTVDIFVECFGLCVKHIGTDKTDVQLSNVGHLYLCNNFAWCAPAFGLVHKRVIAFVARCLLLYVFDQGFDILEQKCVTGQSDNAVAIILLVNERKDFWR